MRLQKFSSALVAAVILIPVGTTYLGAQTRSRSDEKRETEARIERLPGGMTISLGSSTRPVLGVTLAQSSRSDTEGVRIEEVQADGPAAKVLSGAANEAIVRQAVMTAMENPPPDTLEPEPAADVPAAINVRLGDDVHALLRRAAGHALADDAGAVSVEHVRRALDP